MRVKPIHSQQSRFVENAVILREKKNQQFIFMLNLNSFHSYLQHSSIISNKM